MVQSALLEPIYTTGQYFDLVATGVLRPDDRVELLEGVIVAMSPQNPPHASAITWVSEALRDAVGTRAVVRVQLPLVLGAFSAPEPDVAVVPGQKADYNEAHPTTALLVAEIADTSLAQDRLTKAAIYAGADIPEYWIVNLLDDCVEVARKPDSTARRYRETLVVRRGGRIRLTALSESTVSADDLLPGRSTRAAD